MSTLIDRITVIDGTGAGARSNQAVLLDGAQIAWLGPAEAVDRSQPVEQTIDGQGRYLLPALIDAHCQVCWSGRIAIPDLIRTTDRDRLLLEAVATLRGLLRCGVTTVRDVGGQEYLDVALRRAVDDGLIEGPRMQVAGKLICMTGGHANFVGYEADGPDGLRAAVRAQVKRGADLIKLMATGGAATPGQDVQASQFTPEELKAAIDEAHRLGKKVAAHAHGVGGIRDTVLAGVDSVEHGSYLCNDPEIAQVMAERGTYMCATIGLEVLTRKGARTPTDHEFVRRLEPMREAIRRSIALAMEAGVPLASGTDAGGNQFAPHDFSMAVELEALVDHGLSPMEAIVTATRNNARLMGLAERLGTVEQGKLADLLLLDANPLSAISNIRTVRTVFKAGRVVHAA